jgi:hypothetical protein
MPYWIFGDLLAKALRSLARLGKFRMMEDFCLDAIGAEFYEN